MRLVRILLVFAIVFPSSSVRAFCRYNNIDNATTTIPQEFKDSSWVVRARVLGAKTHWSDEHDSWTLYRVEVLHAYKGAPPKRFSVFTFRDSGGFFLDRGMVPDIGGEYLLFLNPSSQHGLPAQAAGSMEVNYSCGVSGPWERVTKIAREQLARLEHAR